VGAANDSRGQACDASASCDFSLLLSNVCANARGDLVAGRLGEAMAHVSGVNVTLLGGRNVGLSVSGISTW